MCTKNGSYCEKEKVRGGGQGRCERGSEAFVIIQKKNIFFSGLVVEGQTPKRKKLGFQPHGRHVLEQDTFKSTPRHF